MRQITEIILHTTATAPEWMSGHSALAKMKEVRRWHMEDRKWKNIGYHYLIDRNGEVVEGRPIDQDGAHVKGRNKGTIGIALVGGLGGSRDDAFSANYTPAQDRALIALIRDLHGKYGKVPVTGHNQYANKDCPCFDAPAWFAAKRSANPEKIASGAIVGGIGTYAAANSQWWLVAALCAVVVGVVIFRKVKR